MLPTRTIRIPVQVGSRQVGTTTWRDLEQAITLISGSLSDQEAASVASYIQRQFLQDLDQPQDPPGTLRMRVITYRHARFRWLALLRRGEQLTRPLSLPMDPGDDRLLSQLDAIEEVRDHQRRYDLA